MVRLEVPDEAGVRIGVNDSVPLRLRLRLEVSNEVGVGIRVNDSRVADSWTSITILAVVQPRFVGPISVYWYEKHTLNPGSVLGSYCQLAT